MLTNLKKVLDNAVKITVIILMILMSLIVLWQVFSRFILGTPSRWSEELARYMMIWVAFLGGAAGLNLGAHLGLDLFTNIFKNKKTRAVFKIATIVICMLLGIVFIIYGYQYMMEGNNQKSMSMNFKMSIVYSVIPISGLLIIINSIEEIIKTIKSNI